MALVLCTGRDKRLGAVRQAALVQAGHTVVSAFDEPTLVSACKEHRFDVAVIGHSIPRRERNRVFLLIRQHAPSAKVLELYTERIGKVLEAADAWLVVDNDAPHDLAEHVSALANAPRA